MRTTTSKRIQAVSSCFSNLASKILRYHILLLRGKDETFHHRAVVMIEIAPFAFCRCRRRTSTAMKEEDKKKK